MITKLAVPVVDPSMQGGRVLRWNKQEGDAIAFGDEICELAVDQFAVLRRTGRATLLSGRRNKKLKSDLEQRDGVYFEVVLTSSDDGILRKIVADEGDRIAIGDLLGVIAAEGDGDLEGSTEEWNAAPLLRVVVNRKMDDWEDDEGE